jgi:type I restriction enzyme, S subunit
VQSQKPKPGYKIIQTKFRGNIEIPESWNLSKLGNECKFEYGKGLTKGDRDNEGFSVYGSGGIIGKNSKSFAKGPGIIVARKGSLGNVFFEEDDFWPIDTVFYISKKETKHHLYFMFYLLTYLKLEKYKIVTAHPGINRDEVYTIFIKIPSLEEQEKISSVLSKIDDLIESYDKLANISKKLKKGLMQTLLTKGIRHKKFKKIKWHYGKELEIPEEWKLSNIENISKKLESGGTPSTKNLEYWNGDIHWTRSAVLTKHHIDKGERMISQKGIDNSSSKIIPKGNLLVASRVALGNLSVNVIDIAINQDVTGILVNKSLMTTEFLFWFLNQNIRIPISYSQGMTIQGFTRKELSKLLIIIPKLEEQKKIVAMLTEIDFKIMNLESKKRILEYTKKGLMQNLLTGKIRV